MKITFGRFFRNTPATIMRCGPTFRLARTQPARARSSGSETLSRSRSLVGYTIDTHESEVFGSHTREFHHLAPLLGLLGDEPTELGGRTGKRLAAYVGKLCSHHRIAQ